MNHRVRAEAVTRAARERPERLLERTEDPPAAAEGARPVSGPASASASGDEGTEEGAEEPRALGSRSQSAGSGGFAALLSAATSSIGGSASGGGGPQAQAQEDELSALVRQLCRRPRARAEERAFVRDVERVRQLLQRPVTPARSPASLAAARHEALEAGDADVGSATIDGSELMGAMAEAMRADKAAGGPPHLLRSLSVPPAHVTASAKKRPSLSASDIGALFECIADLFEHRNADVRALAFEVVILCMRRYGGTRLPAELRHKVFRRIEAHKKDFHWRQAALRALTDDGRELEPFHVEFGWLLLQLLEHSTAQHDLLLLIQDVLHHSPQELGTEAATAVTNIVCARCDHAWARGDMDACNRYLGFFHLLAITSGLELVASSTACLKSLCSLVNADGQGTWLVMKHLLSGAAGFHVLRGLLSLLESPHAHLQWVLRGAVFFVGMSCWGSQRIDRFDDIKLAPALLALESVLECDNGVVVFEVVLALQRLIKKFGPVSEVNSKQTGSSNHTGIGRRIVVEWSIILRMFHALQPWLSLAEDEIGKSEDGEYGDPNSFRGLDSVSEATISSPSIGSQKQRPQAVLIQQTRMPKELLDTLGLVEELVATGRFAGDHLEFFQVLEEYLPYLNTPSKLFLLHHQAEAAHPGYDAHWIQNLASTLRVFFMDVRMPTEVRLAALEVFETNLAISRHVSEDRVIEDVLIPTLDHVYDDPLEVVRSTGIDLLVTVARHLESMKFDLLLDILATAVPLAQFDDAQERAIAGIASLFESWFDHLPSNRALRMHEILTSTVETHRSWRVRHIALSCLLCVSEATSDFHLQWRPRKQSNDVSKCEGPRVQKSRFLYCSRNAVPRTAVHIGGVVPVGRGVRALLTLVSTETHAEIFRMAVEGLLCMLANRNVLCDVDISEVALKVISSISYRAFGRTAVINEAAHLLSETNATDPWDEQSSRFVTMATDIEMVRCIYATTRHLHRAGSRSDLDASMLSAAVLLSKTSFLVLGMKMLAQIGSYASELRAGALQQLVRCFVDGIGMARMVAAERDFFGTPIATSSSGPDLAPVDLPVSHERNFTFGLYNVSSVPSSVPTTPSPLLSSASISTSGSGSYVPESALGFTARVFSRFHPGSAPHGGGFFHTFTGSSGKGSQAETEPQSPRRHQQLSCLESMLRQLYEQELKLVHTAASALSLLSLTPRVIDAQLRELLQAARTCFMTVDGDFRVDVYAAVVEMLSNLVASQHNLDVGDGEEIVKLLLLGFEYGKSKHVAYLSFRLLCQVVHVSPSKDRIRLASIAFPALQQCMRRASSLILESAIDFLMCHAYSRTSLTPPSLRCNQAITDGSNGTSRSWLHKDVILTISMSCSRETASLTVRRATWTSTWRLTPNADLLSDPNFMDLAIGHSTRAEPARETLGDLARRLDSVDFRLGESGENKLQAKNMMARSLPTKSILSDGKQRNKVMPDNRDWSTRSNASTLDSAFVSSTVKSPPTIEMATPPRPASLRRALSFPSSSSLPPLPAYDGIGGSPSYFVESAHSDATGSGKMELIDLQQIRRQQDILDNNSDSTLTTDIHDELNEFSLDSGFIRTPDQGIRSESIIQGAQPSAHPCTNKFASAPHLSDDETMDPMYLMMQLFDLSVESRPQLLTAGQTLSLALNVLDRTPECETHKIGVLYVRHNKQTSEREVLSNIGGSFRYLRFLRGLGRFAKLEGMSGYSGGLDTSTNSDGRYTLLYKNHHAQVHFYLPAYLELLVFNVGLELSLRLYFTSQP